MQRKTLVHLPLNIEMFFCVHVCVDWWRKWPACRNVWNWEDCIMAQHMVSADFWLIGSLGYNKAS
jgi:hypothetical protein